jgi:hypothetical protein
MKKILFSLLAACTLWGVTPALGQSHVDLMVRNVEFRFRPDVLQAAEGNSGFVQGLYFKTDEFPLWLLMDMGGDLLVDKTHFQPGESTKGEDGVWTLSASRVDTVNGYFSLQFAIDSQSGEAALSIADHEETLALYSGWVLPYAVEKPDFRNEKRAQEAAATEALLDKAVPALNFEVKLNTELYGTKASVLVTPEGVTTQAPLSFKGEKYEVVCCERQGQYWFVRLKIGDFAEVGSEEMLLDLAIDAYTGDTNYRLGLADQLKFNWRSIVEGRVVL